MEQQNQQHVMVTSSQPSAANQILDDQNCGSQSRQERIYQLRAQHQRRHQERQGQYPQEEQEDQYERQIQEQVDRQVRSYYGSLVVRRRNKPPKAARPRSLTVFANWLFK